MTHGHFLDLTSVVVFGVRCVQLERLLQRSTVLGVKLDDISDTESDEEDERREGATVAEVRRGAPPGDGAQSSQPVRCSSHSDTVKRNTTNREAYRSFVW